MSRLKSLRVLVRVRKRRGQALDDAVTAATRAHEEAKTVEQTALGGVQLALAAEAAERRKLSMMMDCGQTFDVNMMQARRHMIDVMQGKVVEAQAEVQRCAAETARMAQAVRDRRSDAARNRQKVDALGNDIKQVLVLRQQAEDDEQDEEAEETAISRMIAATRAAAAQAEIEALAS
jgi:Bacterial type III secretion protein (HrpB7)